MPEDSDILALVHEWVTLEIRIPHYEEDKVQEAFDRIIEIRRALSARRANQVSVIVLTHIIRRHFEPSAVDHGSDAEAERLYNLVLDDIRRLAPERAPWGPEEIGFGEYAPATEQLDPDPRQMPGPHATGEIEFDLLLISYRVAREATQHVLQPDDELFVGNIAIVYNVLLLRRENGHDIEDPEYLKRMVEMVEISTTVRAQARTKPCCALPPQ